MASGLHGGLSSHISKSLAISRFHYEGTPSIPTTNLSTSMSHHPVPRATETKSTFLPIIELSST
jgi:hypothetical protein